MYTLQSTCVVRALFLNKILFYDVNLEKNIVLYAKRGKQGHVEEYFTFDGVKVNYNQGLGSKLPVKLPFATMD